MSWKTASRRSRSCCFLLPSVPRSPGSAPGCPLSLPCEPKPSGVTEAAVECAGDLGASNPSGISANSRRLLLLVSVPPSHCGLREGCSSWFCPHPLLHQGSERSKFMGPDRRTKWGQGPAEPPTILSVHPRARNSFPWVCSVPGGPLLHGKIGSHSLCCKRPLMPRLA